MVCGMERYGEYARGGDFSVVVYLVRVEGNCWS